MTALYHSLWEKEKALKDVLTQEVRDEFGGGFNKKICKPFSGLTYALKSVEMGDLYTIYDLVRDKNGRIIGVGQKDADTYMFTMTDAFTVNPDSLTKISDRYGCACLYYDRYDDNFLVCVYRGPDTGAALIRVDSNFNVLATQDPMQIDGVDVTWNSELGCFVNLTGCYPLNAANRNYTVGLLLDTYEGCGLAYTTDVRGTGIPSFSWARRNLLLEATNYGHYPTDSDPYGKGVAIDGLTGVMHGAPQYCFLVKAHGRYTDRVLLPAYMLYDPEKNTFVGGMSLDALPIFHSMANTEDFMFGYCTLTNVFGYPLLYARNRVDGNTYGIILPYEFFDYRKQRVLWYVWYNESIDADEVSPCVPGFGRKTIYFISDTSGDLEVQYDPIGRNQWFTRVSYSAITSQMDELTGSAAVMRFKFSAAATVSAYVLTEPY